MKGWIFVLDDGDSWTYPADCSLYRAILAFKEAGYDEDELISIIRYFPDGEVIRLSSSPSQ
ncbi:MAG: hypothetical protein JRC53_03910 [Deltaproteobacteria bacterium]|nr:hypothetical protein [Deltaproteobacteria bacterium]